MCEQSKDRVLKCYHGNPDHTLNCSIEAKEYMECVEKARQVGWSGVLGVYLRYIMVFIFSILGTATDVISMNSVYIVSVNHLFINTSHALLIQGMWRVGAQVMCVGVGLELSWIRVCGRQVNCAPDAWLEGHDVGWGGVLLAYSHVIQRPRGKTPNCTARWLPGFSVLETA